MPLDFADRTRIPAADVAGTRVVSELPPAAAREVWPVLRLALDFAAGQHVVEWFDPAYLDAWEERILRGPLEASLRLPLGVIVGELAVPHDADRARLGMSCWCVVDWATERYEETALAFAEAAALCWPENGRYAMVAGRLFRKAGRLREAELWLRRARRLAVWYEDWEAAVLSTSSMAMLFWERGNYNRAGEILRSAAQIARRRKLTTLEGEIFHNRLVIAIDTGDTPTAIQFAEKAFARYVPHHHRLPALAYDVASLWLRNGHAARALRIFHALEPHFTERDPQIQVLGAIAKAAGLIADRGAFETAERKFQALADDLEKSHVIAPALVELASGAAALGDTEVAAELLNRALQVAERMSQADVLIAAERLLASLGGVSELTPVKRQPHPAYDALSEQFVRVLNAIPA